MSEVSARLDSGEFYERIRRRWQPLGWAFALIIAMSTPMYCVSQLPSKTTVKTMVKDSAPTREEFARLDGRVTGNKNRWKSTDRRLERIETKLDRLILELRRSKR